MAALGPDGTEYVTQGQAESILRRLVDGVQVQMTALNAETRGLIDQLRTDVQQAIVTSEENAQRHVESLRSQAQAAAVNLDEKIALADSRLNSAVESAELLRSQKEG